MIETFGETVQCTNSAVDHLVVLVDDGRVVGALQVPLGLRLALGAVC